MGETLETGPKNRVTRKILYNRVPLARNGNGMEKRKWAKDQVARCFAGAPTAPRLWLAGAGALGTRF